MRHPAFHDPSCAPHRRGPPASARRRLVRPAGLFAALTIGLVGAGAPAQSADFRGLLDTGPYLGPTVSGVNANGDEIVGWIRVAGSTSDRAAVWDEDTHQRSLLDPAPGAGANHRAIAQETSADGAVRRTVGTVLHTGGSPNQIFVREQGTSTDTTTLLARYPSASTVNEAIDVSRDGRVLGHYEVSPGNPVAFLYDPLTTDHTDIPGITAHDMDAAGTRVVGRTNGTSQAVVWDAASGAQQLIGPLAGGNRATAWGVSASGRLVVGDSESTAVGGPGREAFRWHPDFGMHALEPIAPGEARDSTAYATSDANVVVGRYLDVNVADWRAFIWTPDYGRRDLKSVLQSTYGLGLPLTDWTLLAATAISADGTIIAGDGLDPNGQPAGWVVDLTDEDVANIIIRPTNPPSLWDFYLDCGDTALSEIAFGIVPPATFPFDGGFDFAGCTRVTTVNGLPAIDCANANGLGPNVADTSFVYLPQEDDGVPVGTARAATFYFDLIGQGGVSENLLCEPGDPLQYLGYFDIDVSPSDVNLAPTLSAQAPAIGREASGDFISDDLFRIERTPAPGGLSVGVDRAVGSPGGEKWTVSLDADLALSKFSFGLILPPTPEGQLATFGGCDEDLGGNFNERSCNDGSGLGGAIDFTTVRTFGPAPALEDFGLRGDTLYVYVEGAASGLGPQAQMNLPSRLAELGLFGFDGPVSPDPGFVPIVTFEGVDLLPGVFNDANDWEDVFGTDQSNIMLFSGSWTEPGSGTDWDGDSIANSLDYCPYDVSTVPQQDDGTLEQVDGMGVTSVASSQADWIGDECQCGDSQNDDSVVELDIDELRLALADPSYGPVLLNTPAKQRKCNAYGPVLPAVDAATGLPADCQLNDVFVLLQARREQGPLLADTDADPTTPELPLCPDVTTP